MKAFEPGSENAYICHKEPDPDDINREGEVKVYRLNPDGSKGEFLRTMPAYPEGWEKRRFVPGSGGKKKEKEEEDDSKMARVRKDKEKIMAKARPMLAAGKSIKQTSKELGVPTTTLFQWLKKEKEQQTQPPESDQAANQEPERESQESAETSVAQEEPLAQREQGFGPEDEEPIPYQVVGKYEALGKAIGALVDRKNKQYGDAFNRGGSILEVLYPDGVKPDQYRDMLGVIRVIDKLFRVANGKQGNEDPWQDIAGYGLLGAGE